MIVVIGVVYPTATPAGIRRYHHDFFESQIRFEKIGPSMLVNSQFHKTLIPDLQVFSENHS